MIGACLQGLAQTQHLKHAMLDDWGVLAQTQHLKHAMLVDWGVLAQTQRLEHAMFYGWGVLARACTDPTSETCYVG